MPSGLMLSARDGPIRRFSQNRLIDVLLVRVDDIRFYRQVLLGGMARIQVGLGLGS